MISRKLIRTDLNLLVALQILLEERNVPVRQILRMLVTSFFPLAILIGAVLGSILFGVAIGLGGSLVSVGRHLRNV